MKCAETQLWTLEILEDPEYYLDKASFAVIPVANPDAFSWANAHVRPYGSWNVPLEKPPLTP